MNNLQQTGVYGALGLLAVALGAKYGVNLDANNTTVPLASLGGALVSAVHHSGHIDRLEANKTTN